MKHTHALPFFLIFLFLPRPSEGQAWSGILSPSRAIDWSTVGVPGGIPSGTWAQAGSTIAASSGDQTSAIQAALTACGTNHYVLLGAGTFNVTGLTVPSNCALRGAGANQTILNASGSSGAVVTLGGTSVPSISSSVPITSGATQGSTSIVVSNTSGVSVGKYLLINELNDSSFVSNVGSEGTCTWCDSGIGWNGTRAAGQIVEVTSVSGTTVGIKPALYITYSLSPLATPFTAAAKYAGVEGLQVHANNTGYSQNININECAYCWITGVEGNFADGDQVDVSWSYFGQIQNSYFSGAFLHTSGSHDSCLDLMSNSSGMLVQNNIFERLHVSIMLEWGAAGNVIAHNYALAGFDTGATNVVIGGVDYHGAHPMYNLHEGNILVQDYFDSVWGTSSDNTVFRDWVQGTAAVCTPLNNTRTAVNCTGSNKTFPFQASRAFQVSYLSTSDNFVGAIVGSSAQENNVGYGSGITAVDTVRWPTTRIYDSTVYGWSFGYGESGDDGTGPGDSATAYNTAFQHGIYSNITGATTWHAGTTQILPPSFYLSLRPSWWPSTIPYPAIGPDVTGGTGPGGHVYDNPAMNCYVNIMGGSDGAPGGPLSFNADTCYGALDPPPTGPNPATNVKAATN